MTTKNIMASKKLTKKEKKEEAYAKLNLYTRDGKLIFKIGDEPTVKEFESLIGEEMIHEADCALNTEQNYPIKLKKDGTPCKRQREYLTDSEDYDYDGKKIDYKGCHESWDNKNAEWLYTLVYNGHIVKIGMTIKSLKERYESYSCGTSRNMRKGSCSTTNFIFSECNYVAKKNGITVEIYGIKCEYERRPMTRFGITEIIPYSTVRGQETMLTKVFNNKYNHLPVLCDQSGNN